MAPHALLGAVRGVIFDMDGLLLDSERVAYRIGRDTSAHLGAPWSHEVALRMIGLNSVDGYRLLREAFGDDFPVEAHQAEFGRRYERAIDEGGFDLKPGVHALLDRLDALALPRAVATSTRRARAGAQRAGARVVARPHGRARGDEVARRTSTSPRPACSACRSATAWCWRTPMSACAAGWRPGRGS